MDEARKTGTNPSSRRIPDLANDNLRLAKRFFTGKISTRVAGTLKIFSKDFAFSLRRGDLQLLDGAWYVTHTGLLGLARRRRCRGIQVEAVDSLCDSVAKRFVLKATVYPSKESAGFVGYGDADPSNVSLRVRGAEMRMAETRAVNRALRKAYGVGICSIEEIGSYPGPVPPASSPQRFHHRRRGQAQTETAQDTRYATGSARSSVSTSSIRNWSRPTRLISAERRH